MTRVCCFVKRRKIKKNLWNQGKEDIAFLEQVIGQNACYNVILLELNKMYEKNDKLNK